MHSVPLSRRRALQMVAGGCLLPLLPSADTGRAPLHTINAQARRAADPQALSAVQTSRPQVGLTFDDGPDPHFTPAVLDALATAGVHATFFMIGRNALAHPDLARRVVAAGHEAANHTQDHLWLDAVPLPEVSHQVRDGQQSLKSTGARPGGLFRPPRGWTSPGVAAVARTHDLRSVFWSDCLEAHLSAGPVQAAQQVARAAQPGSILLCHDGGRLDGPNPQREDRSRTVAALPFLLRGLLQRGLTPVPISTLLQGAR